MSGRSDQAPWYRAGLSFTCTRCGDCCTGAPGYVWVTNEEIERLATFRKESTREFTRRYVRRVGTRLSLVEMANGDCVFWDKSAGCTVYEARPIQCRTWPFWPENVETPEDWERTKQVCPGSGQGQHYTADEIIESIGKTRS